MYVCRNCTNGFCEFDWGWLMVYRQWRGVSVAGGERGRQGALHGGQHSYRVQVCHMDLLYGHVDLLLRRPLMPVLQDSKARLDIARS